jgi:hypothetical protein
MNVRRLVALDIYLHGPRFIMLEFGIGTPTILVVGAALTATGVWPLGLYLFLTGVNYVPLLAYATILARLGSAKPEVIEFLSENRHLVRKYSIQQFLLFLPLVVALLAIWQARSEPVEQGSLRSQKATTITPPSARLNHGSCARFRSFRELR